MQKMYLVDEKRLPEVSLSVPLTAGNFCVLDTAAKVNISCIQEEEKVESIGLRCEVPAGRMFTLGRSGKELYRVVESLVEGFTKYICNALWSLPKWQRATPALTLWWAV